VLSEPAALFSFKLLIIKHISLYLQSLLTIIPRELLVLRTFTEKENDLFPVILASEEITTNHEKAICNCNSLVCVHTSGSTKYTVL